MNTISTETGIWYRDSLQGHCYDEKLSPAILNLIKSKGITNCYDLGCGHGEYTRFLKSNGIDCAGYDGNPFTKLITSGLCDVLDLSKEINLEPRDCVVCLEVGEHIPQKFEDVLIKNLHQTTKKLLILSWAIPGQGGEGHFNEKPNEYIKDIFSKLGYTNNIEEENNLRENSVYPWFRNTTMVFEK